MLFGTLWKLRFELPFLMQNTEICNKIYSVKSDSVKFYSVKSDSVKSDSVNSDSVKSDSVNYAFCQL